MNDYLHEIYFLPDHAELKDIHTVLQNYKKVCMDKRTITVMMLTMIIGCHQCPQR